MIVTRAPLRMSFVGGGTDIPAFYKKYPGRVISTTIDKYIYIVLNEKTFNGDYIIKYSQTEHVKNPKEFVHTRFREALQIVRADEGLEIASFADLTANTGLGSSSSFSVALMKALYTGKGVKIGREEIAQAACDLEINILGEPIGKQDQYAAAYGGLNMITFNVDDTVSVEPLYIDYLTRSKIEEHMLLFFTGMTRSASAVLNEQISKIDENFETYKKMSDSVLLFRDVLMSGDVRGMADMLHAGWLQKKSLSKNITNTETDALYDIAIAGGAWGGKILGAGGGGCLLFIVPPEKHISVRNALNAKSAELGLTGFSDIHFSMSQSGVDVLFNSKQNQNA